MRVFHLSLSDNKSFQVSRTILSILADFDGAEIWMVSTCPLVSKSCSPFTNLLGLFRVHQLQLVSPSLLCSIVFLVLYQGLGTYLYFRFLLIFILCSAEIAKSTIQPVSFFLLLLLTITRSNHVAEIRWSVCISKSQRNLCVTFS